jgi:hypothetical protein
LQADSEVGQHWQHWQMAKVGVNDDDDGWDEKGQLNMSRKYASHIM